MKRQRILIILFLFAVSLIGLSLLITSPFAKSYFENSEKKRFASDILKIEKELIDAATSFENAITHSEPQKQLTNFLYTQKPNADVLLFVMANNKPIYWTSNKLSLSDVSMEVFDEPFFFRHLNGWYLAYFSSINGKPAQVGVLHLIRNEYMHQNRFLKNQFSSDFSIPSSYTVTVHAQVNASEVKSKSGKTLFYLKKENITSGGQEDDLSAILCLLGIGFFLAFIQAYFKALLYVKNSFRLQVFYYGTLFSCWLFLFLLDFPYGYFKSIMFSPALYAESVFQQSFGQLLINVAFLLSAADIFYNRTYRLPSVKMAKAIQGILFFLLPAVGFYVADLVKDIVENSSINWSLNEIFSLDIYSYLAFICVGCVFLIYYLLAEKISHSYLSHKQPLFWPIGLWLSSYTLSIAAIKIYFPTMSVIVVCWTIPLLAYFLLAAQKNIPRFSFFSLVYYLFIVTAAAAFLIETTSIEKENKQLKSLAMRLGDNKDPVSEYLFAEQVEKIINDTYLYDSAALYDANKVLMDDYLRKKYFSGYWSKYDIRFTYCRPNDSLLIAPFNITENCIDYIEKKQYAREDFTTPNRLMYISSPQGGVTYLCKLKVYDAISSTKGVLNIYIEFFSKMFPKSEGYPELLLDEKEIKQSLIPVDFSFAKYRSERLSSTSGDFKYPLLSTSIPQLKPEEFVRYGDFVHYTFQADELRVVVARKARTAINHLTAFSLLFMYFGALLFTWILFSRNTHVTLNIKNFGSKLQLFLVSFILFSVVLFGIGTSRYISLQYQRKNRSAISEKMRSVITELEGKLVAYNSLEPELKEYITYYLIKFSNVFYSDINLYSPNGDLIATSRQEVFDVGLIGTPMNPEAFRKMSFSHYAEFIHEEKLGELTYLSGYIPFKNNQDKLLAYLNLPYFAKQNELEKEMAVFFQALVNIYVLLFVLSVIIAFLFSAYITTPIRLLKDKIARVELGKTNELLEWEGDDEIGSLVKEYNRMVVELAASVDKLAKTERESAWREMAKQVAHEIKNPLTPMKLSVQHLKRAYDDQAPDLGQRIEKTAKTLVEQIETLAKIAGEFSDFAKMPQIQVQEVKPEEVLRNTVSLFSETENVNIRYTAMGKTAEAIILADTDSLNRVFSNLLKNAIQAIPEDRAGKIHVEAECTSTTFNVRITDNGSGIPEELRDKIFEPNFTTKSTGAGLGLAMVKNIIENTKGKIYYETNAQSGTVFFLSWPLHK